MAVFSGLIAHAVELMIFGEAELKRGHFSRVGRVHRTPLGQNPIMPHGSEHTCNYQERD
jgi:hypothetical protein